MSSSQKITRVKGTSLLTQTYLTRTPEGRYNHYMGRTPKKTSSSIKKTKSKPESLDVHCRFCHESMEKDDRALFVENEIGRVFCSEVCITAFFARDVDRLEKDYLKRRPKGDLSAAERESYSHLKWMTLQEPEEIWMSPMESGDHCYNLVSEFNQSGKTVWYVCQCLFLNNEPSFLFLGFPTQSEALVDHYRRGQQMTFTDPNEDENKSEVTMPIDPPSDGLATSWTDDDVVRAEVLRVRRKDDIPARRFPDYEFCFQETLEKPDEVLTMDSKVANKNRKVFHFIKHYQALKPRVWYVVIARETSDIDQLEVLDAFPTKDAKLIEHLKRSNHTASASTLITGESEAIRTVH